MLGKTSVSLLQEYCAQKKYSPPLYVELPSENLIFKTKVGIELVEQKFEATGTGTSKKLAKQDAASKMCDIIGLKPNANSSISDASVCSLIDEISLDSDSTPNKTPVSVLQEFCAKNKILLPSYEDLPCERSMEEIIFKCKAAICYQKEKKAAIGQGSNKRNAKHSAARSLLDLLGIKYDWTHDVSQDSVSSLHQMCLAKNYKAPFYEEVNVSGPSHCPEFTIRCSVATLWCEAKAPSKKAAKQKVANEMITVIQECKSNDLEKLKVDDNGHQFTFEQVTEQDIKINENYRLFKGKSSYKKPNELEISDRHEFLITHVDPILLEKARSDFISTQRNVCLKDKVTTLLQTIKLEFRVNSFNESILEFELIHDSIECFIIGNEEDLWQQVADYFKVMLNISM